MTTVMAFGNPLLDTIIRIDNTEILSKFNLEEDGQKEVDEQCMEAIFREVHQWDKCMTAGGCAQNTLRVLQWLFTKTLKAYIFGAVGEDRNAAVLNELLENDGVETQYSTVVKAPTGTTLALINGHNRSLVAHIGAADQYSLNSLKTTNFEDTLLQASMIYIEGFFLTNREVVTKYLVDFCTSHDKQLVFNLSGQYLVEQETDTVDYISQKATIVFGNRREFASLAKLKNLTIDSLIQNLMTSQGKIVVVTDGPNDVFCYHGNNQVNQIAVNVLEAGDCIDTTGAGDAFVSGFLAGVILGKTPEICAQIGCYSSLNIIKQVGCSLPKYQPNLECFK